MPIFATTHWSMVLDAAQLDARRRQAALAALCEAYWTPLYAFLRQRGQSPADAEDLTQAFFADLLDRRNLRSADPQRGRFRTFLLACLKNFVANEHRAAQAQKRGGAARHISLDFGDAETRIVEPAHEMTPDRAFERRWALTVLDRATRRLSEEMTAEGKARLIEVLGPHLAQPQQRGQYGEAAAALGMTEGAVRTALSRIRQRFRHFIRDEVAQTVQDPQQIDQEIRDLMATLATKSL